MAVSRDTDRRGWGPLPASSPGEAATLERRQLEGCLQGRRNGVEVAPEVPWASGWGGRSSRLVERRERGGERVQREGARKQGGSPSPDGKGPCPHQECEFLEATRDSTRDRPRTSSCPMAPSLPPSLPAPRCRLTTPLRTQLPSTQTPPVPATGWGLPHGAVPIPAGRCHGEATWGPSPPARHAGVTQ